jgi:hypothetical protein
MCDIGTFAHSTRDSACQEKSRWSEAVVYAKGENGVLLAPPIWAACKWTYLTHHCLYKFLCSRLCGTCTRYSPPTLSTTSCSCSSSCLCWCAHRYGPHVHGRPPPRNEYNWAQLVLGIRTCQHTARGATVGPVIERTEFVVGIPYRACKPPPPAAAAAAQQKGC